MGVGENGRDSGGRGRGQEQKPHEASEKKKWSVREVSQTVVAKKKNGKKRSNEGNTKKPHQTKGSEGRSEGVNRQRRFTQSCWESITNRGDFGERGRPSSSRGVHRVRVEREPSE